MFHVGQFVTCIDDGAFQRNVPAGWARPKRGEIYEVATAELRPSPLLLMLGLAEIPPFTCCDNCRRIITQMWDASAFRPVSKQSIAIVEALKNLPPLDALDPPTPDERPME